MKPTSARRARRVFAVLAGLAAASLALSGCLYTLIPDTASAPTTSATPDTEGVPAELLPFYEQALDWSTCHESLECATMRAPLDWADPGGREIEISIIRSRAESGKAIGSLLTNPGGPGVSGVSYIVNSLSDVAGQPLREQYDVVGFDPRGVGDSTAVVCYDTKDMDAYLFDIIDEPRGSDAWRDEQNARNQDFADACEKNSDGILPYLTTENSARDMDLLRAVLGDSELYYLGYSYGSFLGATYAKLFPAKVGRLVLDGAVDPSIPGVDVGATQAVGFEKALRAYMKACLADAECPFRGTVDEALADFSTLLESVDRDPLPGADGRMLGADTLMTGIMQALYAESWWQYITIALNDVLQGNPDVAFLLADTYYDRAEGKYTSNTMEAFTSYNCMDAPESTPEQKAAAKERIAAGAPTIAPYWSVTGFCQVWPYPATGVREPISADGAAPIVVIGTTGDPATPYEWAVSLADQLSSGVLITRVGEGHTGYHKGNQCVDDAVETYLLQGTVPQDGLRCE